MSKRNLKISIANIKKSVSSFDKYGKFDVLIRDIRDHDGSLQVLERFSNCNLNPESPNFISRKIGDKYVEWSDTDNRFREYGEYDNQSKFLRVEVVDKVKRGQQRQDLLPYGFEGPPQFDGFTLATGSTDPMKYYRGGSESIVAHPAPFTDLVGKFYKSDPDGTSVIAQIQNGFAHSVTALGGLVDSNGDRGLQNAPLFTASYEFPKLQLRQDTESGSLPNSKDAFFGIDVTLGGSSVQFDERC